MPVSMSEFILNLNSEDKKVMAENLLKKAFENKYGRSTGTYMWQVARLHYFQLMRKSKKDSSIGEDSLGK